MLALAFIASASPARAAVTLRGNGPDDGPRTGWFERYSEARQGPEQIEKVSQTIKVGDGDTLAEHRLPTPDAFRRFLLHCLS